MTPCFSLLFQFLDSSKAVCGTAIGEIRIYDISTETKKKPFFTLNNEKIKISSKSEDGYGAPSTTVTSSSLNPTHINCMVVYENLIIYGDNGFNIKVLDYQKGLITYLIITSRYLLRCIKLLILEFGNSYSVSNIVL